MKVMSNVIHFFVKSIIYIIISIIIGTILLTLVYCIDTSQLTGNISSSALTIQSEGLYPQIAENVTSNIDNFTDSLMLNIAGYNGYYAHIVEALKAHRYCYSYQYPNQELINYYLNGLPHDYVDSYCRYWHGYLVFLKPLLFFTDLSGIRIINCICQLVLIVLLVFLLEKANKKHLLFPFLISYFQIMPIALAKCMQFSTCFYIFIIGSVFTILLYINKSDFKSFLSLFLFIGIITAYFDFLTYPLATFGIPVVFFLSLHFQSSSHNNFIRLIQLGIIWSIGYGFMWVGKWVICTIITGENIFSNALHSASVWVGSTNIPEMLYYNIRDFLYTPASILAIAFVLVLLIKISKSNHPFFEKQLLLQKILPFSFICVIPFFWYFVFKSHSAVHHFYTNKILIISEFSLLSLLANINELYARHQ